MKATQAEDRAAVADSYGDLDTIRQELKARLKVVEANCKSLEATISGWHANDPAEQGAIIEGSRYVVSISPREHQTKIIDLKKAALAMGAKAFYAAAKLSLEALKKSVIQTRYEQLVKTARTGPRTVSAVAKRAPAIELPKAA